MSTPQHASKKRKICGIDLPSTISSSFLTSSWQPAVFAGVPNQPSAETSRARRSCEKAICTTVSVFLSQDWFLVISRAWDGETPRDGQIQRRIDGAQYIMARESWTSPEMEDALTIPVPNKNGLSDRSILATQNNSRIAQNTIHMRYDFLRQENIFTLSCIQICQHIATE